MTDERTIRELRAMLERHGLSEFEFQDGERHVRVTTAGGASTSARDAQRTLPAAPGEAVVAPHAGAFGLPYPGAETALPRLVSRGEIVGLLQIGPLLRPVIAPEDGILERALVPPGTIVGYGDPLFRFRRHPS